MQPNQSTNAISLQSLQTDLVNLKADYSELQDQLSELDQEKDRADSVLWNPRSYEADKERARANRTSVLAKKLPIIERQQALSRKIISLKSSIVESETEKRQNEYASESITSLQKQGQRILAEIVTIDKQLVDLTNERATLTARRGQANDALNLVSQAQAEVQEAKETLENEQSEAFIGGIEVDLSSFQLDVTKTEKRLAEINRKAAAAAAALPRIGARLDTLDEKAAELHSERSSHSRDYWLNYARQVEKSYCDQVQALLNAALELYALDRLTNRSLGRELFEAARLGLLAPVEGRHTKCVDVGDVSSALARLESIFDKAIKPQAENVA